MKFWIRFADSIEQQRKWRAANPHKQKEYDKKRRETNPEAVRVISRRSKLRRLYNLTQIQFDAMLIAQNNCCAICKSASPGKRAWHVDHDHKTGRVRGLLCSNCNFALGYAKDDVERLRAMIAYLESNP